MKYCYRILRWAVIGSLLLIMVMPSWAESPLDNVKEKVKHALTTINYSSECTLTSFRFGRRQETSYRLLVKDNQVVRRFETPFWQQGETISQNEQTYTYYIPLQNAALKVEKAAQPRDLRYKEWRQWVEGASRVEEGSMVAGHDSLILNGDIKGNAFRLMVAKDCFLPLLLEINHNNLLTRSLRITRLDLNSGNMGPVSPVPAGVRWFTSEKKFWQTVSIPRIQPAVSFQILQPFYLPQGYNFSRASIEELPGATVAMLIFDGPEGSFALFEKEKFSEKERINLDSLSKDFTARTGKEIHIYQWVDKQVHLALMGTISLDEMKKIALSVK